MSCPLPPEILDHIVDQMRDDPTTLRTCCLASKSWIHRTRKLLFADISLNTSTRVELWKNVFPDPTNSPAHHARSLSIHLAIAVVDTITTFCGVESLDVATRGWGYELASLARLRGLFPVLRSLYLSFISPQDSEIFGFVCSFPLLEDLTLVSKGRLHTVSEWNPPPTSPRLTGSLKLKTMFKGIQSITRRLLDLPDGIRFTAITVQWFSEQDVKSTVDLASRCADTLQSLDITNHRSCGFPPLSVRLVTYRYPQTRPRRLGFTSPEQQNSET